MKYEVTNIRHPEVLELYRIRALRAIPTHRVKKGDLGGFVSDANLSQEGDCWVGGDAQVHGNAQVTENALVSGYAMVSGDALVDGNAWVYERASVYGSAHVYGNAHVSGQAQVFEDSEVYGNAHVHGAARVRGMADICESSSVYENATVYGVAWVCGDARVYGDARVAGASVAGHVRVSGGVELNIGRYEGSFCYGRPPIGGDGNPPGWSSSLHGHLSSHVTKLFGIAYNENDTVSVHVPSGIGNILRLLQIPESRAIENFRDLVTVRASDVITLFGNPDHRSGARPSKGS